MSTQNNLDDLIIVLNGKSVTKSLTHLENLKILIVDFISESNNKNDVTINIRPTNHVYSRSFDKGTDNREKLQRTGELLLKFEHQPDNPERLILDGNGNKKLSSDVRVFCDEKYESSKLLPVFKTMLETNIRTACVIANLGDNKTCLSALLELPAHYGPDLRYVVFFKFHKVSATEISMIIETAFIVALNHFKIKQLENEEDQKSLQAIIKNILAGRFPFEGKSRTKSKKKYKKLKKQRQEKNKAK